MHAMPIRLQPRIDPAAILVTVITMTAVAAMSPVHEHVKQGTSEQYQSPWEDAERMDPML
jgi:hypothetical protein